MRRRTLLLFLCLSLAACCIVGVSAVAFADGTQDTGGCTVAFARDDGEAEYRLELRGTGISDDSFDTQSVKINEKTIQDYWDEGKITQVYSNGQTGTKDVVRIDLPNYGKDILKFDGTDTVTLLAGFKVGANGTSIAADYTQTFANMKKPTIDCGFPSGLTVTDNTVEVESGTLEFTPVFTAGSGTALKATSVKLNGSPLNANGGKYTAILNFGDNELVLHTENEDAPHVFNEITVTVKYPDPPVTGSIYVSAASFRRSVFGSGPNTGSNDKLSIRFSNVIENENQGDLTVSINGKTVTDTNATIVWSTDGRQADITTLFYNNSNKTFGGFYEYDGTDEITVSGVTEAENTVKMTSDGQLYNVTKGETEPAYKGIGCVSIQKVIVETNHESKNKDAIHIYFNEITDIKGAQNPKEGALLFNSNTIKINGENLQAFWDANQSTEAYWVNNDESEVPGNPYIRVDIYYDGVSDTMWNRSSENIITIDPSFITMTGLGIGNGAGDYTYDAEDGAVYAPGQERPAHVDLTLKKMRLLKDYERDTDWVQFVFNQAVWTTPHLRVEGNKRLTDHIIFNSQTLTNIKSALTKCEIYAGTDGNPDTIRMSISSAEDHADLKKLLKMDGTDVVTVKAGMGLNKYQCVKENQDVPGLDDVTAPEITMTETETSVTVTEAEYEIAFTVTDDSEYDVAVKCGDTAIAKNNDGKYIATLAAGENTITVTATDKSVFKNYAVKTITVNYAAKPVITVSGITDGATVKTAAQKITVSADIGGITGVKLGETVLQEGTDGKYALTLAEGENTITVTAANGSTVSVKTLKVTLDTVAPAITLSAKEETVKAAEYSFTVTASDAQTVSVKLNGTAVTAGANGYTVTLREGENEISVTATDAAGNISSASVKVTYTPEKTPEPEPEKSGCGGSAAGALPAAAVLLFACSAFALKRKRA